MLEVEKLHFTYGGTTEGIRDISFSVPREHIYAILGRSGAGKTTLLQCLGRFLHPKSGSISISGRNIQDMTEPEFRQALGIVFQRLFLFPHMSVLENVLLAPMKVLGTPRSQAEAEAIAMLEGFAIADLRLKYPAEISGGQAQRAAICRSMMLKPKYLLLDEPTAALDVRTTKEFGELISGLKMDTTFIIVTHDTEFVERIATHGVLMEAGCIVGDGDVKSLVQRMKEEQDGR